MPGHFRNGYSNGQQALNSVQVQEGFCHVLVMAGRLMINSCALSCLLINRPSAKAPFFMCIFVHFPAAFPPLRPLARIVSINCLLPDALYPDHTVFHGFPTASGPDKKITGPGSTVHRVRPCIPPPQKRSRGIIRDSFPYLSICFNCPSASPSIQNPSAFPLIRTSSIATARRWYA